MFNPYKKWLDKKHKEWEKEYISKQIKPLVVHTSPLELQQYEVHYQISMSELQDSFIWSDKEFLEHRVIEAISNQLYDMIKSHIIETTDEYRRTKTWSLQVWFHK